MIRKVTLKVNGKEKVWYEIEGKSEKLSNIEVLKRLFADQGELYRIIFGVDRESAEVAGWHPNCTDFSDHCDGWRKFKRDKGRVEREMIIQEYKLEEFVHEYLNF